VVICGMLGIPIPPELVQTLHLGADADVAEVIAQLNLHRRHLTTSLQAIVAAKLIRAGADIIEVKKKLKISNATITRGLRVIGSGNKELIDSVSDGTRSVSKAEKMITGRLPRSKMPKAQQQNKQSAASERGVGRPKGNATINRLRRVLVEVEDSSSDPDAIVKYWHGDPGMLKSLKNAIRLLQRIHTAVKDLPDARV
jgi:ParB-like chromosome segregation protein Spo0J